MSLTAGTILHSKACCLTISVDWLTFIKCILEYMYLCMFVCKFACAHVFVGIINLCLPLLLCSGVKQIGFMDAVVV